MSANQFVTIATHDGTFHMDDLLSVALIKQVVGPNKLYKIIRTRDPLIIKESDWVVDVGQVYDHDINRYDHHQLGSPVRSNGVPYASIGLLWRHYGAELCLGNQQLADRIDREFIQMIDGPDNGVETVQSLIEGGYAPTINLLSRLWLPRNDESKTKDEQFFELLEFVELFFRRLLDSYIASDKDIKLLTKLYKESDDQRILELPYYIYPNNPDDYSNLLFLIYPSGNKWKGRCVSSNFECRLGFPNEWRGLTGEQLEQITNVSGAEFVHKAGFLAVANTKESLVAMCKQAIKNANN